MGEAGARVSTIPWSRCLPDAYEGMGDVEWFDAVAVAGHGDSVVAVCGDEERGVEAASITVVPQHSVWPDDDAESIAAVVVKGAVHCVLLRLGDELAAHDTGAVHVGPAD